MKRFLAALGRRARVLAAREAALDAFFQASYAACALLLADRIRLEWAGEGRALSDARGVALALAAAAAVAVLAGVARAALFRAGDDDLARAADRRLGLADRLTTAREPGAGEFAALVARDAEAAVAGVPAVRVFPARPLGRRAWSLAAVAAALLLLLVPLPARDAEAARERRRRERRGGSGEAPWRRPAVAAEESGGGAGGGVGGDPAGGGEGEPPSVQGRSGRGRPAPPPPLFGDPERRRFAERPEHVDPLLGAGDWKAAAGSLDAGAAAAGAPGAATVPERMAEYRRQAESFVGRDGFPEPDREIVRAYMDRVAPGR